MLHSFLPKRIQIQLTNGHAEVCVHRTRDIGRGEGVPNKEKKSQKIAREAAIAAEDISSDICIAASS